MRLEMHLCRHVENMSRTVYGKCFNITISDIPAQDIDIVRIELKNLIRSELNIHTFMITDKDSHTLEITMDTPMTFEKIQTVLNTYIQSKN